MWVEIAVALMLLMTAVTWKAVCAYRCGCLTCSATTGARVVQKLVTRAHKVRKVLSK